MPYIVCINMPGCLPEQDPVAVATLEEAQQVATGHFEDFDAGVLTCNQRVPFESMLRTMSEDGCVIDVQHVTPKDLASLAGITVVHDMLTTEEIVYVYNNNNEV